MADMQAISTMPAYSIDSLILLYNLLILATKVGIFV